MTKIYTSNTINAALEAVIGELRRRNVDGSRHIIIAPDSYTLSVEKLIPELTHTVGALNIEVVSFSRLAAKELKDKNIKCLSKEGAVLILKKVINRNADRLVHYGAVAGLAGFAREMFAVIAAMRNNSVTVDALKAALPNMSGSTRTKNADIALLYEEYLKELSSAHYDSTTRLEAFIAQMPTSESVAKSDFYIVGFDTFSGKQTEIIAALALYSRSLTIGAVYGNHGSNRELYPAGSIDNLKRIISEVGTTFEEVEAYEVVKEPFDTLNRGLFAGISGDTINYGGALTLFKESNIFEEFNAVAHEISRLVRREGYRYKDIAVIDCRPEHKQELKEVFMRYSIPHFIDIRYPMSGTLAYKYVTACMEAARFNYRADKVRVLIKNPLFGYDENEVFLFENHILKRNINFSRFNIPFEGEDERFEPIRKKLMSLTAPFNIPRATVGYYVDCVKSLLSAEGIEDLLEKSLEGVEENIIKSNRAARERLLEGILPEYVDLIGDESETLTGFIDMLATSSAVEEIALIPRFIDSVYVGRLRDSFVYRPRAVFVIGATADVLPAVGSYKAIMSELDLRRMEEASIRLYPAPEDGVREEQFAVLDLVTKAEKLYIGYPATEPNGEVNKPSSLIVEAMALVQTDVVSLEGRFDVDTARDIRELEDIAVTSENAYFKFLMTCSAPLPEEEEDGERYNHARNMRMRLFSSLTQEERNEIYVEHTKETPVVPLDGSFTTDQYGLGTKVSQIESYFRCPYAHYLQYGLRLKEREDGELAALDVGNMVHEVLEKYFRSVMGKIRVYDEVKLKEEAKKAINSVLYSKEAEVYRTSVTSAHLLDKLERDCMDAICALTENVLRGAFDPAYVEMQFGLRGTSPLAIDTSFGRVYMRGKIDRVDIWDDYVAVLDYKTGKEDGNLADVYFGKKIQLYVYLLAVMRNLNLKPAGAFYVNVRNGYTKEGSDFSYNGAVLAESDIILGFDGDILTRVSRKAAASDIVPAGIKVADDGAISVADNKGALTGDDFKELLGYVMALVKSALEDIHRGYVERRPIEDSCKYCRYARVCGGADKAKERAYSGAIKPIARKRKSEEGCDE